MRIRYRLLGDDQVDPFDKLRVILEYIESRFFGEFRDFLRKILSVAEG
jgi:hypothetical protein